LLYGIDQNSTLLTELVDESGKKIGSRTLSHILIDGNSTFQISIHNVGAGSFSGYIIAKKADKGFISIPLTLATRPLIEEAIILVTIGVCISVCVWEIILQYRDSQKEHENLNIQSTIADKRKKINDIISIALLKLIRVQETKYLASHGIVQPKDLDRIPVDEHAADYYLKDADTKRIKSQILQEQLAQNAKHVQKRKDKNNAPIKSAVRAALLELAPLLFGIFIAMFAILNDQLVIGASVLAPLAIAKLIGIGLATGSLKQLIDK
jgi:hypothetical protein